MAAYAVAKAETLAQECTDLKSQMQKKDLETAMRLKDIENHLAAGNVEQAMKLAKGGPELDREAAAVISPRWRALPPPPLPAEAVSRHRAMSRELLSPSPEPELIARRNALEEQGRNSVTVRVPATTANLGPGYDTIGMALDVWNEVVVERHSHFEMIVIGEGADKLPRDETNLVVVGVKAAFEHAGKEVPHLKYTCSNKIPFGRGLGSSSAAIVSGLIAGLALAGHELSVYGEKSMYSGGHTVEPEELLQLASNIEGHPDNVCPCIYGGLHLAIASSEEPKHWRSSRVNTPFDMQLVAYVPDDVGETAELRKVVPTEYSREDVVYNIGRVAFLINTLNQGRLCDLRFGMEDRMHQPYRGKAVYTHLEPIVEAAIAAGADGACLSGAGPTVLAITSGAAGDLFTQKYSERSEIRIAEAMQKAGAAAKWPGRCFVTRPSLHGGYIVAADPPFSDGSLQFLGGTHTI